MKYSGVQSSQFTPPQILNRDWLYLHHQAGSRVPNTALYLIDGSTK